MGKARKRRTAMVVLAAFVAAGLAAGTGHTSAIAGEPTTGTVSGRVTADDTDQPIAGACVGFFLAPPPAPTLVPDHQVVADADGHYEAVLPVGSYRVFFEPPGACATQDEYVGELFDDVTSFLSATIVEVTAGTTRAGVDADLARPSHLTGRVTADDGGAPLEGMCVHVASTSWWLSSGEATTDASGGYDIGGLMAGSYEVRFRDCTPPIDFLFERYDDDGSETGDTTVVVGVAAMTGGVDAALATAGHITGTVTEDGTGRPVAGACVSSHPNPSLPGDRWIEPAVTGADGAYDLGGLRAGTHQVGFYDCTNANRFSSERYDDVLRGQDAPLTPVELGPAEIRTGIDAGVQPSCDGQNVTVDLARGQAPTEGADVIIGTTGADTIDALSGDDWVCGRGGADRIRGGAGADRLFGARGGDLLAGGPRADLLVGGRGTDECLGGVGRPDQATGCERRAGVP